MFKLHLIFLFIDFTLSKKIIIIKKLTIELCVLFILNQMLLLFDLETIFYLEF